MLFDNEIPQRQPLLTVSLKFETRNLEVPKIVASPPGFKARIPKTSKVVATPPGFAARFPKVPKIVAPR